MANYIADQNKFKLSGPPKWWLTQLYHFDPSFVVVPSRQGFYYRLAQRRRLQLSEKVTQGVLWNESDTKMLASYGLIPVTTILATANWSNPFLFEELRRRSVHRMGGAEKVNAMIEAQEAADEAARQAKIDDVNTILAKDAWGLYNKKIGVRSQMWSPKTASKPASPKIDRSASIKIVNS